MRRCLRWWVALGALCASTAWALDRPAWDQTTRLIVKFKEDARVTSSAAPRAAVDEAPARVRAMAQDLRTALRAGHILGSGAMVLHLDRPQSLAQAREWAARLSMRPDVEYAEPDVWVRHQAFTPNDTYYAEQWALAAKAFDRFGSAAFSDAWDAGFGSPSIIVAVIDTGRVMHPDLDDAAIGDPLGYDFVSDREFRVDGTTVRASGDGDGRDPDPSDPGDHCEPLGEASSWHGLKMAGIARALTHNGRGVAGAAPGIRLLQVRALGRCGGWLSDVADALRWSAGGVVEGVPPNTSPVRVASLSLGSQPGLSCNDQREIRQAVEYALSAGVVVVAAAGNEGASSVGLPAGCQGVIAVGAHTVSGDLADYSNRSSRVTLTAPGGGGCLRQGASCNPMGIVTLGNSGDTGPGANLWQAMTGGTSAATPFVSAAVALMLSANESLTPSQVEAILKATARPHAADSHCAAHAGQCGAGMLDAHAAVRQAIEGPLPRPQESTGGGGSGGGGTTTVAWFALLVLACWRARRLQAS